MADIVKFLIEMPESLRYHLKVLAAKKGKTMASIIIECLEKRIAEELVKDDKK